MELRADGVTVTEIAPGVDLERDVLAQAAFRLKIAPDLKEMASFLFDPAKMGAHFRADAA
jgi:acyl CoA:acetate/3-ketoacid CoA transferase